MLFDWKSEVSVRASCDFAMYHKKEALHRSHIPSHTYGAETIFRFGVLQLRVGRVEILHPRVIASEVHNFNILQNSVRALFIRQARVLSAVVLELRVLGLRAGFSNFP
jgi:hypothetical protein